jgi:hypothetical protein
MKPNDSGLLAALSLFGYPLFQAQVDPNDLLASLAQSADTRLLEGFPVVLANALSGGGPKVDLTKAEAQLEALEERKRFRQLAMLSFYLFDLYGLGELRQKAQGRQHLRDDEDLKKQLDENRALKLHGNRELDPDRLKKTFLNYVVRAREGRSGEEKARVSDEFRREFYLSLLFSPRQKDLLYKKLHGEPMTKTEREYFSRVVKKKLMALADPDLYRLAQKALQTS